MILTDELNIAPANPGPVGILVEEPFRPSDVYLGSQLNRVEVRGAYPTGIKLLNCWNPSLVDCCVSGALGDEREYANPQVMQIGIDVGNSMDAHIIRPRITSAATGIFAGDPEGPIRAEGLHIEGGFIVSGGIVDDSVALALHATPSCRNITTSGKTWERAAAQGKIVNRASVG